MFISTSIHMEAPSFIVRIGFDYTRNMVLIRSKSRDFIAVIGMANGLSTFIRT